MRNRIKRYRTKLKMTQAELAQAVGTSQQQIQRIEKGDQSVKLDAAARICSALGHTLTEVFPQAKALVPKGAQSVADLFDLRDDPTAVRRFDDAGIDVDPVTWLLVLRMRGGAHLRLPVSTADRDRLRAVVEMTDAPAYLVCRSGSVQALISTRHLMHYHELFESPAIRSPTNWEDPDLDLSKVSVYLVDSKEPLTFDVPRDEPDDDDPATGQMGYIFFRAELSMPDEDWFFHFTDDDGEDAFFRMSDVSLMTVPLTILDGVPPDPDPTSVSSDDVTPE